MDFLTVVIVLTVAAIVIFGSQVIFIKIFTGEADRSLNDYNSDSRFNPRGSLNRMLNRKMIYYSRLNPLPMRWLVFYQNFILPLIAVFTVYNICEIAMRDAFKPDSSFYISLAYVTANLINAIIFRGIDKYAFYLNFAPSAILLFSIIYPFTDFNGFTVFVLFIMVPILGGNAYYFIRRRGLFLSTLRQMKQEVDALDAQNAS